MLFTWPLYVIHRNCKTWNSRSDAFLWYLDFQYETGSVLKPCTFTVVRSIQRKRKRSSALWGVCIVIKYCYSFPIKLNSHYFLWMCNCLIIFQTYISWRLSCVDFPSHISLGNDFAYLTHKRSLFTDLIRSYRYHTCLIFLHFCK